MFNTVLAQLVDILLQENSGSTAATCYHSGPVLGGQGYIYCGYFTALDDADMITLSGGSAVPVAGVPQTFVSASGADFDFVGYRIRLF